MTDHTSPPSSSLIRAFELDTVRDVMLLETEEQLRIEPIPRYEGAVAPLALVEGQMRLARLEDDVGRERELALTLSREHFERALDVDLAVQLLHRALEIEDDRELRRHLAAQLSTMGRHIEAGHVLRDGEPTDADDVYEAWLASGGAYARSGDSDEAVATLREAAMALPDSAGAYEGIAAMAYWASDLVAPERAADAFLEAARRYPTGSDAEQLAIMRAVEVAPAYARAAEALSRRLHASGRSEESDDVWRRYGHASGHQVEVAHRRTEDAKERGDWGTALAAAFEAGVSSHLERRGTDSTLAQLTGTEGLHRWLEGHRLGDGSTDLVALLNLPEREAGVRGQELLDIAELYEGEGKAVFLVLASDAFSELGDHDRAVAAARSAVRLAPWSALTQAAVLDRADHPRVELGELEVAIGAVPGSAGRFLNLAERYMAADRHALAFAWLKRVVAMRPGDRDAIAILLERAADATPSAYADAISLAIGDQRPWRDLSPLLAHALDRLLDLDSEVALEVAHRVLKTVGPGDEGLFAAIMKVAETGDDPLLALGATLGRAVGDEVPDESRGDVYVEACARSLALGDPGAAAVHLSRAAAHGVSDDAVERLGPDIRRGLEHLPDAERSDATLSLARAEAWASELHSLDEAVAAWRRLGALRFDLAEDIAGADEAFFAACSLEPEQGPYRYAQDLVQRAGPQSALPRIVERALSVEQDGNHALCGRLYAATARLAADDGILDLALDAAVAAVRADPSRGDAVAIVEKIAAAEDRGLTALNFVYDTLADAALGRYGFRAAHYRAARQLEKLRAYGDALRHAVLAFEAVPSIGASYQMLLRLAVKAEDENAAMNILFAVASSHPIEAQIAWLVRAAEVAKRSTASAELRIELLLKALALRPRVEIIEALEEAATPLDEANLTRERLHRAVQSTLPRLEDPRDTAIAVALGRLAAQTIDRPKAAADAVLRAADLDPHDSDFTPLLEAVDAIAADRALARRLLDELNDRRAEAERPFSTSLRELTSRLYLALSDMPPAQSSSAPAHASSPAPGNALSSVPARASAPPQEVDEGELTFVEAADSNEREEFLDIESTTVDAEEAEAIASVAAEIEVPGAPADSNALAQAGLEWTVDTEVVAPEVHQSIEDEGWSTAVTQIPPAPPKTTGEDPIYNAVTLKPPPPDDEPDTGHEYVPAPEEPEAFVPEEVELPEEPPEATASEFEVQEEDQASQHETTSQPPGDPVVEAEEVELEAELLEAIDAHVEEESAQLAPPEAGSDTPEPPVAEEEVPSSSIDFSPQSEQRARERGDHGAIAGMLAARARATNNLDQRRLIRLRRAAVLEQRLGRLDDACAELEHILEESGEDPTALRYLADLSDRQRRHARAAKLWLRASQQATDLEEKLRDVTRCCSSLIAAGRPETARRLIDAARGLPQSPRMLELRVKVAEQLGDLTAKAQAEAELAAFDVHETPEDDEEPPLDRPSDPEVGSGLGPRRLIRRSERPRIRRERRDSNRRIFRVTGAPPPMDDDADRSPAEVLDGCRMQYVERGPGGPREAKRMIRRLRSVGAHVSDEDRDLYTYLLVESLDAAQGTGAATHALQQHWENHGGTPLVTLAVADRLVRRNDLRPALQLYRRTFDRDLRGVRSNGAVALQAAELAQELGDGAAAQRYLRIAAHDPEVRPAAEVRHATWFPGSPRLRPATEPPPAVVRGSTGLRWSSGPSPASLAGDNEDVMPGSRTPTDRPQASKDQPSAPGRATDGSALDDLALDDDLQVRGDTDAPPPVVSEPPDPDAFNFARPPTIPELASVDEEALFRELIDGNFEAGDALVTIYQNDGLRRSRDILAVRRYQTRLRRGDRRALDLLREAALADSATAYARAVEHVAAAFDPQRASIEPPPLDQLTPQPESTSRLLFGSLDATVNEAVGLMWEAGVMRREMSDYDFTGIDRVPPVATTPLGKVFAALSRLLDLGGVRLFHRARTTGRLRSRVALVSPLAAIISGTVVDVTPTVRYTIGSALAAASPRLSLVEGVDERESRTLIAALLAGFGPITDGSMAESTQEQMRLAEDLWHLIPAGADRRLRAICDNAASVTYEVARTNARRARRRAGLFACGELVTAIAQTMQELELRTSRPLRGQGALRDVCSHPEIADLFDLAILPEFAEVRWRTA